MKPLSSDPAHSDAQPVSGLGPLELLALLHPNRALGPHLAQLALAPLFTAGALAVARTSDKTLGMRYETVRIRTTGKPAPGPGSYAAVLDALTAKAVPEKGLELTEVAHRLQKAFGYGYHQLLSAHTLPLLVERGLVEQQERRRLGLFRTVRYVHTPSGEQARAALEAWVRRADQVPALMKTSIAGASAYAAGLGVAVLLSDTARPYIGRLVKVARAQGLSNPTSAPSLEGMDDPGVAGWAGGIDTFGDVDAGGYWDTLGDLSDMGSFDGGADGGSGDGGGD